VFAGKKSAQIREILISESAWEEMTCLFAPSLSTSDGNHPLDAYPAAKVKSSVALPYGTDLSTHLACPGEQLSCMSHYKGLVWIDLLPVD
ncbi:hypothetical protein ABS828_26840, partial [Klebsiella pneumoniae]